MTEDNQETNRSEKEKRVVGTSVVDYTNHKEYNVTYDDGTAEKHIESKRKLVASRYPRYVDFIKNAKVGDIKKEDEADKDSSDKE